MKLNLCLTCRRRLRTCVCDHIESFMTHSRFIILMHPMEFKKEKVGTGRFCHLILQNSKIIVDVGFDENVEFKRYLTDPEYDSFILYPGEGAFDLTKGESFPLLPKRKAQFFVIDGTWPCAKKMMKLTTSLHALPRVSFSNGRLSEFQVKHQPMPGCLSTAESLHQLIMDLNHFGIEDSKSQEENLMRVFKATVNKQVEISANPNNQGYRRRPSTPPEARKISKKWCHRLLFFKSAPE